MHIQGERVGRKFGGQEALRGATFECRPGEIIALIGNNGAGKTTLLQLIAGLLAPTQGTVYADGEILDRRNEELRRRIAIIPDFPPFFADHSVIRHIAMVAALHHVSGENFEEKALLLMKEIGIAHLGQAKMLSLSRGEIYKTVFVSLLLTEPDLWLLDEPMASGMDPQGLTFLRTRLREATKQGSTIIYSTQIAEIAEKFSDRVFVLKEGRLLTQESTTEMITRLAASSLDEALQKVFGNESLD